MELRRLDSTGRIRPYTPETVAGPSTEAGPSTAITRVEHTAVSHVTATRSKSEWEADHDWVQKHLEACGLEIAKRALSGFADPANSSSPETIEHWVEQAVSQIIRENYENRFDTHGRAPDRATRAAADQDVVTGGMIAINVIKNAKDFPALEKAVRSNADTVAARERLEEGLDSSIQSHTEAKTKKAIVDLGGGSGFRDTIGKIFPQTSRPAGGTADVDLEAQRTNRAQIVEKVADLSRNDGPRTFFDKLVSTYESALLKFPSLIEKPYSREIFDKEVFPRLPDYMKVALQPALEEGKADRATAILGHIPYGLSEIIADIHVHYMGYDRRKGMRFALLLNMTNGSVRMLFGSIPQYCGGAGHYSNAVPTAATMKNSVALDERLIKEWEEIYNDGKGDLALAARADLSITGVNFSEHPPIKHQAFDDPVAYITDLIKANRADLVALGELTDLKEQVTRQLGADWRWTIESKKFLELLEFVNQTGQIVLLHHDWGNHRLSDKGRPAPAKQQYENFDTLTKVFGNELYRYVQIILAHTGIGRFVRPNDEIMEEPRVIKTWEWNKNPGAGEPVGKVTDTITKLIKAPQHIHKIYELFEKVPNARVDIAWNEVTQAYIDLMHSNPEAAAAIVQLFMDHADRILFGSDTVKPVNEGQYQQSLMTGSPLLAEILRLDIENAGGLDKLNEHNSVAFKILRGNYDATMELGYDRLYKWMDAQGFANEKTDGRKERLEVYRKQMHDDAWNKFEKWAEKVHNTRVDTTEGKATDTGKATDKGKAKATGADIPVNWGPMSDDFKEYPIGLYPELYRRLEASTDLPAGGNTGAGTSGGFHNDDPRRQLEAGGLTLGILVATGVIAFGATRIGNVGTGATTLDRFNALAFAARSGLAIAGLFHTEKLRVEWEDLFEKGNVTRQGFDRYVGRMRAIAPKLGITEGQLNTVAASMEQFWVNYSYLADKALDPEKGWTDEKKQQSLAIYAKLGAYQGAMSRMLHLQDSTINATDARHWLGRMIRGGELVTYAMNLGDAFNWLRQFVDGAHKLHGAGEISEETASLVFHCLFAVGNSMFAVNDAYSLAGGFREITDTQTGKFPQHLQLWGSLALATGAAAWSLEDIIAAVREFIGHDPGGGILDIVTMLLKCAFTYCTYLNFTSQYARVHAKEMKGPLEQAIPQYLAYGALGVASMIAVGVGDIGAVKSAGSGAGV